jgi:hypothetical protein
MIFSKFDCCECEDRTLLPSCWCSSVFSLVDDPTLWFVLQPLTKRSDCMKKHVDETRTSGTAGVAAKNRDAAATSTATSASTPLLTRWSRSAGTSTAGPPVSISRRRLGGVQELGEAAVLPLVQGRGDYGRARAALWPRQQLQTREAAHPAPTGRATERSGERRPTTPECANRPVNVAGAPPRRWRGVRLPLPFAAVRGPQHDALDDRRVARKYDDVGAAMGEQPPSMYFPSPYHLTPSQRRRHMEIERSLHQIWSFLFVFVVLCLLLF